MNRLFRSCRFFVVLVALVTQDGVAQLLPQRTAIDDYVQKPDASYRWEVASVDRSEGLTTVVVDMVSQTWRTEEEVDRTEWQHALILCIPDQLRSDCGFLYIGGGSNGRSLPSKADGMMRQIAMATGTVVSELKMVPNQPLVFGQDGQRRVEDDLVGYTWDKYLETGDPTWPARNPMVKSAVRAMDTVTAVMAAEVGGRQEVKRFVVAGGSKRGWTTWLTGAVDQRVVGIIPVVIDVLNTDVSMRHHFASYGFWAPAVGNYVQHRIMQRMDHPRLESLYKLVDPYYYRHRLTMPKLVLNSAGDQFFLPDSSKFYWRDLKGPKYLRYVPNSDHGLDGTDAVESIVAFYSTVLMGRDGPQYDWAVEGDTLVVETEQPAKEVRLWQATNPLARDFRLETLGPKYTSELIAADDDGRYRVKLAVPDEGWRAYFVELTYDVGAPVPLKLTTGVQVVPDVVPFAEKLVGLPASVTVVCQLPDGTPVDALEAELQKLGQAGGLPTKDLIVRHVGATCYINWQSPPDQFHRQAGGLTQLLSRQGYRNLRYQLESGNGPTIAPGLQEETNAEPAEPQPSLEDGVEWYDVQDIGVEGKAWADTESFFDRLPAKAKDMVRSPVWALSQDSAGMCVRFVTDAQKLRARWSLRRERLAMPHMPATGASGVDLYVRHEGTWRWLATGRPQAAENNVELISGILPGKREYLLYLPLYNGVNSIEIGVPQGNQVARASLPADRKPIVFWGTSITHGASASRPGMCHPAILGRRLERPVVNLGFSGNGRMEPEVAQLVAEIDAAVYVIDCLPNITGPVVAERTRPLVEIIRAERPDTPIVLVEDRTYANAFLIPSKQARHEESRAALRTAFEAMQADGIPELHYLEGPRLLGADGEDTVDSSHPTDLGFWRQADAFEAVLRPILDE
ncbi:MAG: hypothetical protein KDA60_13600 [Planctomycetales bacterium]|nr:hypothetical protein [Planctomycetales bacterium]